MFDKIKFVDYNYFIRVVTPVQESGDAGKQEEKMKITGVKVRKLFPEGPMKAVVSVTFEDCLAVHDIKVINAGERFFVVMPSRKKSDGTFRDIVHPINSEFRALLETEVLGAYNRAIDEAAAELSELYSFEPYADPEDPGDAEGTEDSEDD